MYRFCKVLIGIILGFAFVSSIIIGIVFQLNIKTAFLSGDTFQHGVAALSLLATIIIATAGGLAVTTELKKRKRDACYGYFINLETMLKRLRQEISDAKNRPNISLYKAMSNHDKTQNTNEFGVFDSLASQVRCQAIQILNYFSMQNNIVPAGDRKERQEWDAAIIIIIDSACEFEQYGNGNAVINFTSDTNIKAFHEKLLNATEAIFKIIVKEKVRNGVVKKKGESPKHSD